MKNTIPHKAAKITCILAAFILASCIYEAPGDRFYRTLWESDPDTPFGTITMEFLCGNKISVGSPDATGSFGSYESEGNDAFFSGLTLTNDTTSIILSDATRNGDTLILEWHRLSPESHRALPVQSTTSPTPPDTGTILMHRLSAYK